MTTCSSENNILFLPYKSIQDKVILNYQFDETGNETHKLTCTVFGAKNSGSIPGTSQLTELEQQAYNSFCVRDHEIRFDDCHLHCITCGS